jgi:hypothetical protein
MAMFKDKNLKIPVKKLANTKKMKKIALIELYYHNEVLRTYIDLLKDADGYEIYILVRNDVWHENIKPYITSTSNLNVLLQGSDIKIPDFINQHTSLLNECSLVFFMTIENHFKYFSTLKLDSKKLLILHNSHTFLKPSHFINWNFDWLFCLKILRSKFLHQDFKFLPQLVENMDGFVVGNKSIANYIENNSLLPLNKTLFVLPFTFFQRQSDLSMVDKKENFHITIPGSVSTKSRDYEIVFDAFNLILKETKISIQLEFLGKIKDKSGANIIEKFKKLENISTFKLVFHTNAVTESRYEQSCKESDIIIVPSCKRVPFIVFYETISQSSLSGGFGDAVRYGIPALFPAHYQIEKELIGFFNNYNDSTHLKDNILKLMDNQRFTKTKHNAHKSLEIHSKNRLRTDLGAIFNHF